MVERRLDPEVDRKGRWIKILLMEGTLDPDDDRNYWKGRGIKTLLIGRGLDPDDDRKDWKGVGSRRWIKALLMEGVWIRTTIGRIGSGLDQDVVDRKGFGSGRRSEGLEGGWIKTLLMQGLEGTMIGSDVAGRWKRISRWWTSLQEVDRMLLEEDPTILEDGSGSDRNNDWKGRKGRRLEGTAIGRDVGRCC